MMFRMSKYDIIEFGSYPQSEVKNLTTAIIGASYNSNGDATVDGVKYRRITKGDAMRTVKSSYHYNWTVGGDSNGYHYFKYEPIKWRVLSVNGNDAFLLADVGLDVQKYHEECENITWENCTIRSFLNGKFLNSAFTKSEQKAIYNTNVINDDNPTYKTPGGTNTTDKVYLLSLSEIINPDYGFEPNIDEKDPARRSKISDYAHAMGAWKNNDCWWWLRSPGWYYSMALKVYNCGSTEEFGVYVNNRNNAVRPALHLNLSKNV